LVSGTLISVAVVVVLGIIQALLTLRDRRRFGPPGAMVKGLHVLKLGDGLPVVVFESGIANSCLSWSLIQPQVAKQTTTYSYDRAGLGWSLPASGVCSLEQITGDLHALIDALKVPRPLILVGHSFGGYVVRLYAHRFPAEVAGLVLVDPATPEEWMNPSRQQRWRLRRAIFFTRAAGVLACFGLVRLGLWLLLLRRKDTPGPLSRFSETLQRIRFEVRKIPRDVLPLIRAHWSRPGFYWAMAAHLKALPACARAASSCPIAPQFPVTVLSGAHQSPERLAEHAAIATRHVIAARSAHFIHLDEPELVVDAVREVQTKLPASSR
jgi:pimeloyl-ACP methyl ester carboxylesterase